MTPPAKQPVGALLLVVGKAGVERFESVRECPFGVQPHLGPAHLLIQAVNGTFRLTTLCTSQLDELVHLFGIGAHYGRNSLPLRLLSIGDAELCAHEGNPALDVAPR